MMLSGANGGPVGPGIGHTGGISGYLTHAFHFPEHGVTIAAVVASEAANPNDILVKAIEVLFP